MRHVLADWCLHDHLQSEGEEEEFVTYFKYLDFEVARADSFSPTVLRKQDDLKPIPSESSSRLMGIASVPS